MSKIKYLLEAERELLESEQTYIDENLNSNVDLVKKELIENGFETHMKTDTGLNVKLKNVELLND